MADWLNRDTASAGVACEAEIVSWSLLAAAPRISGM